MKGSQSDQPLFDQSIGELLQRLMSDMAILLRKEFDLFRIETTEKTKRAGKQVGEGAGILSGAAVCATFSLGCLTVSVILLLSQVISTWMAALICAAVYGIAAGIAAIAGKRKFDDLQAPVPEQTIETVKEDVEWTKTRTNSVKR